MCWHAIAQRVEGFNLQVLDHLTLTSQTPTLLTLCPAQCLGFEIGRLSTHAAHQAGMATASPATAGHGYPGLIQGVEQIGIFGN